MIEKIRVDNFQSHKKTILKFHPGVNVITGTTDSGKTALLRGLNWCVWNTPSGDAFRSTWGGITKVEITIDGRTITRSKDKSDLYELDGVEYKTFGRKAPEDISLAFNMDSVNLQQQLDSPFLLAKEYSAGAVATYFNKVANISKIDEALKAIKADKNKLSNKVDSDSETLVKKQEELTSFDYLVKMRKEIKDIQAKEDRIKGIDEVWGTVGYLFSEIQKRNEKLQEIEVMSSDSPVISSTLDKMDRVDKLVTSTTGGLNILIKRLNKINTQSAEHAHLLEGEEQVAAVVATTIKRDTVSDDYFDLLSFINKLEFNTVHIKDTKENRIVLAKSLPDICPLCGNKMNNKHKH